MNDRHGASETSRARLIEWTGERCVPWASDYQMVYEHLHRYHFAAALCHDKRVLDLACGEGYGSAILAEVAREVVGIDNDAASMAHARANHVSNKIRFLDGSMLDSTIIDRASFDVVVCFEALEHVEDHDAVLSVVNSALRDGGVLVISTPDRIVYTEQQHNDNPFHVHEVDRGSLTTLLASQFANVAVMGQTAAVGSLIHALDEGHGGRAELIAVRGDGDRWPSEANVQSPYLVAMASNAALPALPKVSTFIDTEMLLARRSYLEIANLTTEIAGLAATVRLRDDHIEELESIVRDLVLRAESCECYLATITTSRGWRSVMTFRRSCDALRRNSVVARLTRARRPRS